MVNGKLNNCKVFLMYGDESISEEFKIIDNKYLVLKHPNRNAYLVFVQIMR
jgi:hypothetical protein